MINEQKLIGSRIEGFDKKMPSVFVVSIEEFEQLKAENDEDVLGFSYEEYCEIEREGWNDIVRAVIRQQFEALESIPLQKAWWSGVKTVEESDETKNRFQQASKMKSV